MAVSLLRVLVLGVIAAAADDVPVKWVGPWSVSLPCAVPEGERAAPRRPPPPLDDERARPRPYLWRVGNHTLNRSDDRVSANGSLEVSRRRDGKEGVYQCAVRTAGGVVLGYPVHLKFAYINSRFSAAPENTTVAAGQPAVLRCDVGSGPRARVRWLRGARALPQDDRYIILENQLLILDVQKEDEGYYRCNATNPVLNKTRTSPAARLAVTGADEAHEVGFLPLQHEAQLAVPRGSRVVLPCPVTGWPRPKIVWEVTPAGGRRSELESVAQTLALDAVQPADEGRYSCAVEGRSDLVKSFVVSVTEAPVVTLPPAPKQSLPASTVRFNCTAAGRPPPRLAWYKDGKPLVLTGRIELLPSVDGKRMELLIRSVTSDDAGVYQCFAAGAAGAGWASAWARLGVSGAEAAAPRGVRCQPAAAARVRVRWERAAAAVLAYTVQTNKPGGTSLPGQPITSSEEIINVGEPLTPYGFQVRAYIHSVSNKTIASDLSKPVICQGQGVPLKLLQLSGGAVLVSWRQFALEWPGVRQWLLQARPDNSSQEHNVTLDAAVTNYTVALAGAGPLQVRVLGTRALPWLQQDLTLVPWTSSAAATHQLDSGGVTSAPSDVEVTAVGAREFTVRWRHDEADLSPETFSYTVCVRKVDGNEECIESASRSARVSALAPASEYSVRVRARPPPAPAAPAGPAAPAPLQPPARRASDFTAPVYITTQPEGVERFKDLTYKLVNASCLRVSWHSQPDKYIVHYSDELKLPINQWAFVETNGNTVLLNGLDLTRELYVMVTGYEPVGHSPIFTIPVQIRESEIQYSVGAGGVRVWWAGRGARVLHYSQNITRPLDAWATRTVDTNHATITGLDLSKPTYVMVAPPGVSQRNQVITIEPQPPESYSVYLVVGVACALAGAGALAGGAACAARRRKRSREPHRSRRRNPSRGEGDDEEGSEMKALGTRLANGTRAPRAARAPRTPRAPPDPRDAGEPLLNGHVHITENPTSKTSNGKLRKGRLYEAPFDVSRRSAELSPEEAPASPAPPACLVLDTSRAPAEVTALSALADKLPDDNMNSQVRRGSAPTLQPNG